MTKSTGFMNAHNLGRKILKENDFDEGICSFGVATASKGDTYQYLGGECHARLNGGARVRNTPTHVVDALYKRGGEITSDNAKEYLRYVLMQSPFSSMFAEKDINKGFNRGYFLYDANQDANLLVGGAVAVRMLSEMPEIPYMWYKLVKAGVDPDMAFLGAPMSGIDKAGNLYVADSCEDCHVAITPTWLKKDNVRNFLEHNNKPYGSYADKQSYGSYNGMWGEEYMERGTFSLDIYMAWLKGAKEVLNVDDGRVALFNHKFNKEKNEKIERLPQEIGFPIITKILNDYRSEVCQN